MLVRTERWMALLVLGLGCMTVLADPVRILQEDPSRSIDARPYLRDILNLEAGDPRDEFVGAPPASPYASRGNPFAAEGRLPVITPELSPGPITQNLSPEMRQRLLGLSRPLFIIGADAGSLAWLAAHRDRLAEVSAIGQLVQARNPADLEAVAAAAGGLPILVAPASDIAQALGIRHYPVLISREGMEQ